MAAPKKEISLLATKEETRLSRFLRWILGFGRWIVIVTELIVILCFLSRFKLDRELTDLGERIRQQQAIILSFGDLEKDFRNLQERLSTIEKLEKEQLLVSNLLDELSKTIPLDVTLRELTVQGKEVGIAGLSLSEVGLGSFIKALSESRFEKIILENISKEETGGIEFKLKAEAL